MYLVTIRRFVKTKSPKARKPYRCVSHRAYSTSDEEQIAKHATDVLREAGKGARYSGMEEFGSAHEFWNDKHECPEDGTSSDECEELELDACREWLEKSLRELRPGDQEDLHLSGPESFTEVAIRRVRLRGDSR